MSKNYMGSIEPFSHAPLVELLPHVGKLAKLKPLTSSLFARFERLEREDGDPRSSKEVHAEEAMLQQVLHWLQVTPGGMTNEE